MKNVIWAVAALGAGVTAASAGGLERTPQSMAILFEEGRYMELSFGYVMPEVSGTLGGNPSGDMLANYSNLGLAYKADLNDTLSYAIIFDQPYGADTAYPTGTGNTFAGSSAKVRSNALSGVLQYNLGSGGSVYGGLRAQSLEAEAVLLPASLNYTINSDTDYELGYLVGAAYERPDIALRVSLTYHSETSHDLNLTEASNLDPADTNPEQVNLPQALNLEFQSGVAEDTLVFGSVRWAEWSETEIDPSLYNTRFPGFPPIVFFTDDRITYTLGVGRRLNDTWSVLGSLSHEETTGSATGNLGPTDGFTSVSLGAIYRKDNMKITGGLRYVEIGDAMSFSGADFQDNSALAAGLRVGWSF